MLPNFAERWKKIHLSLRETNQRAVCAYTSPRPHLTRSGGIMISGVKQVLKFDPIIGLQQQDSATQGQLRPETGYKRLIPFLVLPTSPLK